MMEFQQNMVRVEEEEVKVPQIEQDKDMMERHLSEPSPRVPAKVVVMM